MNNRISTPIQYSDHSTKVYIWIHFLCLDHRAHSDPKINARSKSPGPGSRGPTSPTSPLHPLLFGLNLDSPTGKQEDGKNQYHPLPLPPGSPTSPSALPNNRTGAVSDNTTGTLSKWKKGKLLGRGSFGHVYVGFNRWLWIFMSRK